MKDEGDLDAYAHVYVRSWPRGPGRSDYCRAAVHDGGRSVGFHQCGRKPAVERTVSGEVYGFCRQHDPVEVRKRRLASDAKWRSNWDRQNRNWDRAKALREAEAACVAALRSIADGHNDARGLAAEALATLDAIPPAEGKE